MVDFPGIDIPDPRKILGPLPIGNPGHMRDLARLIRRDGESIGRLGDALTSLSAQMTYEGPAARRFFDGIARIDRDTGRDRAEMLEIADYLEREADQVEQAQATWHRRFREIEEQGRNLLREARERLT